MVASCVMTFEARDSAAKVVPARFKMGGSGSGTRSGRSSGRRTTSKHVFRKISSFSLLNTVYRELVSCDECSYVVLLLLTKKETSFEIISFSL